VVEVICRDTAQFTELLRDRIQRVDGVVSTESLFVLEIHKMAHGRHPRPPVPEVEVA
jgi:Lrp/AsnC family transcriptional regulator for asnA, asnC and gidA